MPSAAARKWRACPGIKVRAITLWVYAISGALAGIAAVILAARLDSAQPSSGLGYELDTIAAVVIGGASLSGGVGTIGGTLVGVLIIGVCAMASTCSAFRPLFSRSSSAWSSPSPSTVDTWRAPFRTAR